jgi:3',5'-cyclic AMP phosphodiesterase CpdA
MRAVERFVTAVVAGALAGCPSGWHLVRVEGETASIHPDLWDEVHCTATHVADVEAEADPAGCGALRRPLVHCSRAPYRELCRGEPNEEGEARTPHDCSGLTSLLSFVHLSDAQLKDHRVVIEGAISGAMYDRLTNGTRRHELLERHDDAVLLATVLGINQLRDPSRLAAGFAPCKPPAPPRFAIHTGDAMDSGMFSELLQFMAIMTELEVPFFDVVGNHDNLFFGTFPPSQMKGLDVLIPYVPVVDTDRFMRFHAALGADYDLSLPGPVARGESHRPTVKGCPTGAKCDKTTRLAGSLYHGFDLVCPDGPANGPLCPEARGYYAFDIPLAPGQGGRPRKVRAIVLNTAEIVPDTIEEGFDRGSKANMLPEQLRWLQRELAPKPGVYHLVFGHHTLESYLHDEQGEGVRRMLLEAPRLLAYVCGHTHVDDLRFYTRPDGSRLWELIAGSTLIYPQLARVVELLEQPGDGKLYLRVASLRQRLGDRPERVSAALQPPSGEEGEEDNCARLAQGSSFCSRLAERAHLGRKGGLLDTADADRRFDDAAIPRANALVLAYDPARKGGNAP